MSDAPTPTPSSTGSIPRRILVVDDDATFRQRLLRALAARGYEAHEASTADEGVEVARRVHPAYAVVDLRMPGKSGLDLVRELVAAEPQVRIVMLTGYGSIATAVDAVRAGAVNYLAKPADADQILAALNGTGSDGPGELPVPSLARVEWEHIQRILTDCDGNISEAARRLGIHRRSLQRKLGKLPPIE